MLIPVVVVAFETLLSLFAPPADATIPVVDEDVSVIA
jgi:hypothetical protein